jgi:hypothetical protein
MKSFNEWMNENSKLSAQEIEKIADENVSTAFDNVESYFGLEEDEIEEPYGSLDTALESHNQNGRSTIFEKGGNKQDLEIFDAAWNRAVNKYLNKYRNSDFVKARFG